VFAAILTVIVGRSPTMYLVQVASVYEVPAEIDIPKLLTTQRHYILAAVSLVVVYLKGLLLGKLFSPVKVMTS
jgi:hypothetical protein